MSQLLLGTIDNDGLGEADKSCFRKINQSKAEWFNGEYFGMKPGLAVDSTAGAQATIAAAGNDSVIYIPPGIYRILGQPTFAGLSNVTVFAYGATFLLIGAGAEAFRFADGYTNTDISIFGLKIIGSGTVADDQQGIGTRVSPGASTINKGLLLQDVKVTNVVRGIYLDVNAVGDAEYITYRNCKATAIGTAAHQGYGMVLSGVNHGLVDGGAAELCERHGVYISVSNNVKVKGATFRKHRQTVTDGSQLGALEIARSYSVTAQDNTFDTCYDGAVSSEPHETDGAALTRGVTLVGNTFYNSQHRDIWVGGPTPATSSELSDVEIAHNTFIRPASATNVFECIRVRHGRRVGIKDNTFWCDNSYTGQYAPIYVEGLSSATLSDQINIKGNEGIISGAGGVNVFFVELSTTICGGASGVNILDNDINISGGANSALVTYDAALTNQNVRVVNPDVVVVQVQTGGGTIAPNLQEGTKWEVNVGDATPFTVAFPNAPGTSDLWWVVIFNNTAGAMGAITWNAGIKFTNGAWVNPAAGKRRNMLLMGNKWRNTFEEVSRSTVDY